MIRKTDRNGQAFYWEYDCKGRCTHTKGDGGIMEGWIQYNKGYNVVINSVGESTTYYYNENNLCVQETDSYGNSKFTEYTELGQLYREIDEEGNITGYTYDEEERLKEVVQPDGTSITHNYNDQHQLIMISYPDGTTQTYVYDERKRIAFINYSNGQFTAYNYNERGLLETVTSKGSQKTSLEHDEDANLVKVTLPDSSNSEWKYDTKGRCVQSTNAEGQTRRFSYDSLDRVRGIQLPDGNHLQLEYNAYEEVIKASDRQSLVQFEYTPLGLLSMRKQNGTELQFHYDTEQRLTYITNEAKKMYRFGYNKRGEITKEVGFDGLERIYNRDKAGKVIKTMRPGDRSTIYEYDANGRIMRSEYHDGSWETFGYDKNGNLIEALNQFSTVRFKRNKLGLVEQEAQDNYTVQSGYDEWGNRISIQSSLGAAIQQQRDRLGNVTALQAKVDDLVWQTQMKYNKAGQEIERLLPGNIRSQWRYDNGGRPSEHVVKKGSMLQCWKKYTWEVDDRLTEIFEAISNSHTAFKHDEFGNLVWAQYADNNIVHRATDETGNIYETPGKSDRKYGTAGQLLESKKYIYKYDEEGNLTSKTDKYTQAKWKYNWYANGMLQKVTRPDGKEVTLKYDALGRRTEKCFNGLVTRWIWDGNVPLHEWQYEETQRPKPVVNEWGELSLDKEEPTENITTWIFDADGFKPAAKINDGQTLSIVCDYLGTPQEMYNEAGKKIWEGVLDIYGRTITLKGEKSSLPFRYQGQYEDVESGLYYNRFRYYNAEEGIYICQDPIRLRGGFSLYSYVHCSNFWVDPLGLARKPKTDNRLPEGKGTDNGPANGALERRNPQNGELLQIRTYDANGKPILDIDYGHDHGAGDPHAHDWEYPSNQAPNKSRGEHRPLIREEQSKYGKGKTFCSR
jgi:RHS repeat-associated protein